MGAASASATPRWEPRTQRAGAWELTALSSGWLRLDGGSMWGVVPATMWREWTPPDADNTIRMACRPFLARRGKDVVLIEPGVGTRWEEKWRKIYHIECVDTLEETLARVGVAPEGVTHVVASHCHWDHIGSQVVERDGELAALFPNARHFAPSIEIAMAKKPGHARSGSYRAEDVLPIEAAGLLEGYEGTREIVPGLVAHVLGGHSDGVSVITLGEGSERAIFWADVVPTTHHVQPPYIMAYDLDVVRSFEVRSQWLAEAARGGWLGMFFHDEHMPFARITKDGKRYGCEPV
ncbi:MAG: MBL fold metallo-hydrolase [Planctomycetes bacterium]|nr:MBL fold metallo-hydrolase [Planctomycetota bacterium]